MIHLPSATIHEDLSDYIDTLHDLALNGDGITGTQEAIAERLHFSEDCDLSSLSPSHYNDAVWDAIDATMKGMAISATSHSNLDFFCKTFNVWMTPAECVKYGRAVTAQKKLVEYEWCKDQNTRRAVMTFDREACEQSVQWIERAHDVEVGKVTEEHYVLFVIASFRSLDAMHLPTDLHVLKQLTKRVFPIKGQQKLIYVINAGSFHLYDRDIDRIETLWEAQVAVSP